MPAAWRRAETPTDDIRPWLRDATEDVLMLVCVLATRFRSELGHQGERAQCTGMAKITAEQLLIVKGCAVHTTCTGPGARAYLFS